MKQASTSEVSKQKTVHLGQEEGNTEVRSGLGEKGDEGRGGWEVTTKNLKNSVVTVDYFDAVMICTGHHAEKKV